MNIERLTTPWWSLRVGVGAAAFLAGLDKFFNLLTKWPAYLSPIAAQILPLGGSSYMPVIGASKRKHCHCRVQVGSPRAGNEACVSQ